jgi:uncharacterized protein DUF4331
MSLQRALRVLTAVGAAAAIGLVASMPLGTKAADHLDGPSLLTPPGGNLRADINDLFVFRSATANKTVLALTTHPAAGFVSPLDYATNVDYVIDIDRNGDAVADVAYAVRFGAMSSGSQPYTVTRYTGRNATTLAQGIELGGGTTGSAADLKGGARAFAGLRSDPFFFDLGAFLSQVAGVQGNLIPGVLDTRGRMFCDANTNDFFSILNANAIVLEVSNDILTEDGTGTIGVWARTIGASGQIDRMGRPAINTVFNHGAAKTTFNQEAPTDDRANFETSFRATLEHFGYDVPTAKAIAEILLPDVITYQVGSMANGAALNGRGLADDVIDAELGIVTKGAITTDCVGPHGDYLASFPYVGEPHR